MRRFRVRRRGAYSPPDFSFTLLANHLSGSALPPPPSSRPIRPRSRWATGRFSSARPDSVSGRRECAKRGVDGGWAARDDAGRPEFPYADRRRQAIHQFSFSNRRRWVLPMDRWFYTRDKRCRIGPHTLHELRQLLAIGALQPSDMVHQDGEKKWVLAGSTPQLADQQHAATQQGVGSGQPAVETVESTESQPWFVWRGIKRIGPFTTSQMKDFAASNPPCLAREDLVERFGIPGVMNARQFGELFALVRDYYIIRDRVKYGPFTIERMQEFVLAVPPLLRHHDYVQAEDLPIFASQLEELFLPLNGKSRKGGIYLVTIPCMSGFYKIGKTIDIDQRVYQFGLIFPEKPKLVHQIETNHIDYAEKHWHQRFAHRRANGEWFGLASEDVQEFCRCSQMSFPVEYKADFFAQVQCAFASPITTKGEDGHNP